MVANIVVWKSKTESPKAFFDSLDEGQRKLTVLLSPEHNDLFPSDETNLEQWTKAFVDLEQKNAHLIAEEGEAISTIVHVLLDGDSDKETHTVVSRICEVCAKRKYKKHIIWLCNKFSICAANERAFLGEFYNDIEGKLRFDIEFAKEKLRLENEGAEKKNKIMANKKLATTSHDIIFQIATETKEAVRAKKQELETKHLQTRWDRLSILFDTDSNGGQSEEVNKLRSAAAVGAVFAAEKIQDEFEIRCYGIKKTPYSQEEYNLLPSYCFYKHIRDHKEDKEAILKEIMPNFSCEIDAFACTDKELLAHALLANDNDYEARGAGKLIEAFVQYNPEYDMKGKAEQYVQNCVANWLENVKTTLAQWVDLDDEVLLEQNAANTFEEDMRREIPAVNAEDVYKGIGNFGRTVQLTERLASARELAERVLRYLPKKLKKALYESAIHSFDELRSYLQTIKKINTQMFDPYGKMEEILACNSSWQKELMGDVGAWFQNAGKPTNGSCEEYRAWLERTLEREKTTLLKNHGEGDYAAFSKECLKAADEIKLTSDGLAVYDANEDDVYYNYAGYRCRLISYSVDPNTLNPEMLFVPLAVNNEDVPAKEQASEEINNSPCPEKGALDDDNILRIVQEKAGIKLSIKWPDNVVQLRVDVRNSEGKEQTLKKGITNDRDATSHEEKFTFSDVPPGRYTFLLIIDAGANKGQIIAKKVEEIDVPEVERVRFEMEPLSIWGKIKKVFAKKMGYQEGFIAIPKLAGMRRSDWRLQMSRNGNQFLYPLPAKKERCNLIVPETSVNSNVCFKIVYKDV